MQYRLRTLLILMAVLPPMLWAAWLTWERLRSSPAPAREIYYGHKFILDVF